MTLSEYRNNKGLSLGALARLIGVANRSVVKRYENGDRIPRAKIMQRIKTVTGGLVTADDFYPSAGPGQATTAAAVGPLNSEVTP